MAGLAIRIVVVTEPPVIARMVISQGPHYIAVVVHIYHVRLCYGANAVHAVPQRVVHIPGAHMNVNSSTHYEKCWQV